MHDGLRVLDADAHVIEPAGLFGAAAPPGVSVIDLPATTPMVPCGDPAVLEDFLADGCSAREYLRCMDREGIDAVVLYPSIGLFVPFLPSLSPEESAGACRAYNEWLAGYRAEDPARLTGVALVPTADVALAAREAEHAAALGLPGVMVRPNALYGRDLGDPAYDQLYRALEELELTLSVHEGLGVVGPTIGRDRSDTFAMRHAMSHPMEQMAAMASLMLLGALERHPGLRVAFLESGTGWLPYWLARLDSHAEWMEASETASLSLRPSEYFARQCVICTDPDDPLAAWVVGEVGADHVMWASDFPHPDALYPEAVTSFLHESEEHRMSEADVATVLWETPRDWYGWADVQAQGSSPRR
ncbi:MAG TPA: amidohydrolase family protein [Acidimicrobiia bacterium]